MHKNYLEFIHAYYYLIIVAYFVNLFEIKKLILYVTKVYRLIGMEKLNVLRVKQCEDG
jgi:hypothetical protein